MLPEPSRDEEEDTEQAEPGCLINTWLCTRLYMAECWQSAKQGRCSRPLLTVCVVAGALFVVVLVSVLAAANAFNSDKAKPASNDANFTKECTGSSPPRHSSSVQPSSTSVLTQHTLYLSSSSSPLTSSSSASGTPFSFGTRLTSLPDWVKYALVADSNPAGGRNEAALRASEGVTVSEADGALSNYHVTEAAYAATLSTLQSYVTNAHSIPTVLPKLSPAQAFIQHHTEHMDTRIHEQTRNEQPVVSELAESGLDAQPEPQACTQRQLQAQKEIEIESELQTQENTHEVSEEGIRTQTEAATQAAREPLRVVAYYPAGEVLSNVSGPRFCADHADWAQVSWNGQQNKFDGSVVFWVDADQESCWLSFNSGYREYFKQRIKTLVNSTSVDGIWIDVPIYFDAVVQWCDYNPSAVQAFKADTGMDPPPIINFANANTRRWVAWRHDNLRSFLLDVRDAARSVRSDIVIVVETVTCDYADATKLGLDGAYLKDDDGIIMAWEIDTLSDSSAMRFATYDDWLNQYAMLKHAVGASGNKPSWAFSYGKEVDDARPVLSLCIQTRNNPYEVRTPLKEQGVDSAFRSAYYRWAAKHSKRLFDSNSLASIAVYHSSASRDFVDQSKGRGMYTTVDPDIADIWSSDRGSSVAYMDYMGEYRGVIKLLAHQHLPLDVLVSPRLTAACLAPYSVLLAPMLDCVSDSEWAIMQHWVSQGGLLVMSGQAARSEYGNARAASLLQPLLGALGSVDTEPLQSTHLGNGTIVYCPGLPFKQYMSSSYLPFSQSTLPLTIESAASPFVHMFNQSANMIIMDVKGRMRELIVQLTNVVGARAVNGSFAIIPQSVTLQFDTYPANQRSPFVRVPPHVVTTSPDDAPQEQVMATTSLAGETWFSVTVTVIVHKMVIVAV